MAGIVIIGAGVVGLGTVILLAGDGHQVTVLERDKTLRLGSGWRDEEPPGPGREQLVALVSAP